MRVIPFYGSWYRNPPSYLSAFPLGVYRGLTACGNITNKKCQHKIVFSHATSLCNNFHFGARFDLKPARTACGAVYPLHLHLSLALFFCLTLGPATTVRLGQNCHRAACSTRCVKFEIMIMVVHARPDQTKPGLAIWQPDSTRPYRSRSSSLAHLWQRVTAP